MGTTKTERFLDALGALAPTDDKRLGLFTVRSRSTCVADVEPLANGTVSIRSLVGLTDEIPGRQLALAAICYFADLFDVTLLADSDAIFRDVGRKSEDAGWLRRFGFAAGRGAGFHVRLPQSLHRVLAA
jgi:hypothetical protein